LFDGLIHLLTATLCNLGSEQKQNENKEREAIFFCNAVGPDSGPAWFGAVGFVVTGCEYFDL
jgi:hypothetical protein